MIPIIPDDSYHTKWFQNWIKESEEVMGSGRGMSKFSKLLMNYISPSFSNQTHTRTHTRTHTHTPSAHTHYLHLFITHSHTHITQHFLSLSCKFTFLQWPSPCQWCAIIPKYDLNFSLSLSVDLCLLHHPSVFVFVSKCEWVLLRSFKSANH